MTEPETPAGADLTPQHEVFRSPGPVALAWTWLVVAVAILADVVAQDRHHTGLVIALFVAAGSGLVYGCAWRPRIVADAGGITLVNPLRDHLVPWAAVTEVDAKNALRVHCAPADGAARGKILASWAIQSSPRSAVRVRRRTGHRPPKPGGYVEPPEPPGLDDALDRRSAETTAARLAELAQHARKAGAEPGRPDRVHTDPARRVSRWAWGPAAAMIIPIAVLLAVALS